MLKKIKATFVFANNLTRHKMNDLKLKDPELRSTAILMGIILYTLHK